MTPKSQQIFVAGIELTFTRKSVRNINLRVNPRTGKVMVSAPKSAPRALVEAFIISRIDWITEAQQKALSRKLIQEPSLHNGERIAFLGKYIELKLVSGKKAYEFNSSDNLLTFFLPDQADSQEGNNHIKKQLLDCFYRAELQSLLPPMLEKWEPVVGVRSKECRVRKMRTRWGSCNIHQARIWMSLELIKYPLGCIEYVLVHELTHLLEPSHNKRFHSLVGEAMPDWKDYKKRLNKGV